MTTTAIRFGRDVPDDRELRLCGDISGGKRAIELGISREQNSIAFALAGAKAIAVDPSPDAIAGICECGGEGGGHRRVPRERPRRPRLRHAAARHRWSSPITRSTDVDDLGRLLRQVHRVLRASHPFVISVPHPFAGVHTSDQYGSKVHPYGTVGRTIGDWFMHLSRANFRVDQILELGVSEISPGADDAHAQGPQGRRLDRA